LYDFYLLADNGQFAVEMGSKDYNLSGYGSDFESKELCDVLWECIKLILKRSNSFYKFWKSKYIPGIGKLG